MNANFSDLKKQLLSYNPDEIEKVTKAYEYAKLLHEGQFRQSGEPYIIHPVNVAYILTELHADGNTVCAGLLHDVIEDTPATKEDIAHEFNQEIADLVDGVTKLAKMNFSSKEEENLANTRKLITGITTDVRIIIIKLADRLHNMRTLEYKEPFKQKENSLETMDIFVPLAYYIGAYDIKSELEDLSFKYLKPEMYKTIEWKKHKLETNSNACLQEMLETIKEILTNDNIPNELKIRTKNIYGIYKRLEEGQRLQDIHDLLALKVLVDNIANCYRTLGLVHAKYHPINDKFKDYICNPKTNMYQSLHTTVFGPQEHLVQTQIRTFEMDRVALYGLTAYWDVDKGRARETMQEDLRNKFQFFSSLVDIDSMFSDNKEFIFQIKSELFGNKIYVYTPQGNILELPKGSTPIDFAYKIHTDIGNTMIYALVNDKKVADNYVLQNKDRVRIITDNIAYSSKENWEEIAQTSYAKKKIRDFKKNHK